MYESQVGEYKYEIERLARELQDVKKKYFMQKKKEQQQRSVEIYFDNLIFRWLIMTYYFISYDISPWQQLNGLMNLSQLFSPIPFTFINSCLSRLCRDFPGPQCDVDKPLFPGHSSTLRPIHICLRIALSVGLSKPLEPPVSYNLQ